MRTTSRTLAGATALLTAAAVAFATGTTGLAASSGQANNPAGQRSNQGDHQVAKVKDNRGGSLSPTAEQRRQAAAVGARARWNRLGTPSVLASTGAPLASGLGSNPVQAAQAYIAANRDLLGLTARGAAALKVLTVAPLGNGAAVIFQQRFGNLAAGRDGMLSVGVRDGKAWFVSSSLARDANSPAPATLTAAAAEEIARADAGTADATIMGTQLVAVPTADRGARAAYEVVLGGDLTGADPVAYSTYVDARDGAVL